MQHWNGQDTLPTALYIWTQAELVRGNARHKYREYTDCLDVLTQHQVTLSVWDSVRSGTMASVVPSLLMLRTFNQR